MLYGHGCVGMDVLRGRSEGEVAMVPPLGDGGAKCSTNS